MKSKLITILALAAPVAASAQINIIAGWDFGQFTAEGFATTISGAADYSTSIDANFSSTNGFNPVSSRDGSDNPVSAGTGAINWAYADASNSKVVSFAGSQTINTTMVAFAGTEMSNGNSDAANLALGFSNFNGGGFSLTANMTGYQDYTPVSYGNAANFSFAAASEGAITITWSIGGNSVGTSSITAGTLTGFAVYTLDLPASFYNANSTLTGAISGSSAFAIDNVQINGVAAIPEPSTYAALAGAFGLVLAAYRRRRAA